MFNNGILQQNVIQFVEEIIEIAIGLNDKIPKLEKILKKDNYGILLVEHKDRQINTIWI